MDPSNKLLLVESPKKTKTVLQLFDHHHLYSKNLKWKVHGLRYSVELQGWLPLFVFVFEPWGYGEHFLQYFAFEDYRIYLLHVQSEIFYISVEMFY